MAIEHANSFVERIFENDEFLKAIIIKRGFSKNEHIDKDMETEKIVKIANDMGFKFNISEYESAFQAYMGSIDGWEAAQKIFHMFKILAMTYQENND